MRLDWWTLALQTVNVLVLVWLLARFLFRPVMALIERRRAAADQLLADAAAARAQAQAAAAAAKSREQALAADGERIVAEARAKAETERAAVLQRAAAEAAQQQTEATAAIARERQAMRQGVTQQAAQLALAIARRLLGRLPPEVPTAAFLESLPARIAELPEPMRAQIAGSGEPIEVVTAAPLGAAAQAACRQRLAVALHADAALTFRTDPALLGGVELHAAHVQLRDSWQADLDRIARELAEPEANAAAG